MPTLGQRLRVDVERRGRLVHFDHLPDLDRTDDATLALLGVDVVHHELLRDLRDEVEGDDRRAVTHELGGRERDRRARAVRRVAGRRRDDDVVHRATQRVGEGDGDARRRVDDHLDDVLGLDEVARVLRDLRVRAPREGGVVHRRGGTARPTLVTAVSLPTRSQLWFFEVSPLVLAILPQLGPLLLGEEADVPLEGRDVDVACCVGHRAPPPRGRTAKG
jgi:hypothetical protein